MPVRGVRTDDDNPTGMLYELLRQTREDQGKSLERIERRLEGIDNRTQEATSNLRGVVDAHAGQIAGLLRWQGALQKAAAETEKADKAWRRVHAPALALTAAGVAASLVALAGGMHL